MALVPIGQADRLLGVIHLADTREDSIAPETLGLLENAALQLASSLTRTRTEEKLVHLATHDALNELPTRAEFDRILGSVLALAQEVREGIAVRVADLDHFKGVNDTLGHDAGDRLLVIIAERLGSVLRSGDTVARIGGDEFVQLLRRLGTPNDAATIASKLLQRVPEPLSLDMHALHVTISFGVACCPTDGDSGKTLLKSAEGAMYCARNAGRDTFQWCDKGGNAALV